ncbi:uncharacterized protein LOC111259480 isoform X2 [Varroa jacobsoni]|uniref:uncharacterized protein LOC111259480 isoform X2 n=1 Tax=Varroa jacobsoni TaxID=62625 RepID=UPI000BF7E5A7|nr:uncharacterized protein LOC111259480 isoform X2 [Varroa jacobsoni]
MSSRFIVQVDASEEPTGSPSRLHREPSPLLQSPPTSDDEATSEDRQRPKYHSNSDCLTKLELLGCAACGECFESSEALVEHQEHRCAGLSSDAECEEELTNFGPPPRPFIACAKCPELSFNGRCDLIRHLKGHRKCSIGKNKCNSSGAGKGRAIFVKMICLCQLRPCRCPARSHKKIRPVTDGSHSGSAGAVLCNMCFAGKLSLGKETDVSAKKERAESSPSACVHCAMYASETQRHQQ